MGIRVPENHVELVFRHRIDGDNEDMLCTIGCSEDTSIGQGFGQAQANDLSAAWGANVTPYLSPSLRFKGLTARSGPDGLGLTWEVVTDIPGTYTGACLPPNCALLIHKRTQSGGRRNRGRFFLPGVPEGTVDQVGNLMGTYPQSVAGLGPALFAALAGVSGVGELAIFHTTPVGVAGLAPTQITSMDVDQKIATQRRRMR